MALCPQYMLWLSYVVVLSYGDTVYLLPHFRLPARPFRSTSSVFAHPLLFQFLEVHGLLNTPLLLARPVGDIMPFAFLLLFTAAAPLV